MHGVLRWRRRHNHVGVAGSTGDPLELLEQTAADARRAPWCAHVQECQLCDAGPKMRHDDSDAYQPSAGDRTECDPTGVDVVLERMHLALDGVFAVTLRVPSRRAPVAAPCDELGAVLVVEHVDAFPAVDLDDAKAPSAATFETRRRVPPPHDGTEVQPRNTSLRMARRCGGAWPPGLDHPTVARDGEPPDHLVEGREVEDRLAGGGNPRVGSPIIARSGGDLLLGLGDGSPGQRQVDPLTGLGRSVDGEDQLQRVAPVGPGELERLAIEHCVHEVGELAVVDLGQRRLGGGDVTPAVDEVRLLQAIGVEVDAPTTTVGRDRAIRPVDRHTAMARGHRPGCVPDAHGATGKLERDRRRVLDVDVGDRHFATGHLRNPARDDDFLPEGGGVRVHGTHRAQEPDQVVRGVDPPVHEDTTPALGLVIEPGGVVPGRADTDGGHAHDVPDQALVEQLLHQRQLRAEALLVAHRELDAGLLAGGDHRVGLLNRHRDRLLAEDVLARLGGSDHRRRVRLGPGGDGDHVDVGSRDQVVEVLVGVLDAERVRRLPGPGRVHVGHGDYLDSWVSRQVGQVLTLANEPTPDDADAELPFRHARSSDKLRRGLSLHSYSQRRTTLPIRAGYGRPGEGAVPAGCTCSTHS